MFTEVNNLASHNFLSVACYTHPCRVLTLMGRRRKWSRAVRLLVEFQQSDRVNSCFLLRLVVKVSQSRKIPM